MRLKNSYIYIPVRDLQRALNWYSEHLGFRLVVEDPFCTEIRSESGVRAFLIHNDAGNVTSQMHYRNGIQAAYGFTVDEDIPTLYGQLRDKGIRVGELTDYQGLSFKFFDPDGNAIELWGDYPV